MLCVLKALRGLERIKACSQSDSEEKGLGTVGFPWKMRTLPFAGWEERWMKTETAKAQWVLPSSLPLFPQKGTSLRRYQLWGVGLQNFSDPGVTPK